MQVWTGAPSCRAQRVVRRESGWLYIATRRWERLFWLVYSPQPNPSPETLKDARKRSPPEAEGRVTTWPATRLVRPPFERNARPGKTRGSPTCVYARARELWVGKAKSAAISPATLSETLGECQRASQRTTLPRKQLRAKTNMATLRAPRNLVE